VFTSIPLLPLLEKLPAYFLKEITDINPSPFDRLAWDFSDTKPSFRHFCQEMSDKFLRLPSESRLRDTTAGSVRLAVALLRPWFHKMLLDDFDHSTITVFELSCVIGKWPAQWWTRDHAEMWDLIKAMVKVVAEELQEKKVELVKDKSRSTEVLEDFEQILKECETGTVSSAPLTPPPSTPASPLMKARRMTSSLSIRTQSSSHSVDSESVTETVCEDELPTPPASPTELTWSKAKSVRFLLSPSPTEPELEPPVELEEVPTQRSVVAQSTSTPTSSVTIHSDVVRPHSMAETASCIVTGFLFGAYIALCILASQRRPIAIHLT
jgi:hypothetical protein